MGGFAVLGRPAPTPCIDVDSVVYGLLSFLFVGYVLCCLSSVFSCVLGGMVWLLLWVWGWYWWECLYGMFFPVFVF